MHGINTIKALNDAAVASHEKATWPAPVAAGTPGIVDTGPQEPVPDTPAVSQVEQ